MAPAPSKWIPNRQLNSLTVLAQPIYQHAHGLRGREAPQVRKSKALSTLVCFRRTGQERETERTARTDRDGKQPSDSPATGTPLAAFRRMMDSGNIGLPNEQSQEHSILAGQAKRQ